MKAARPRSAGSPLPLIIAGICIFFVLGAGAAWYLLLRSTPEQTVKKFLAAAQAGNEEQSKALMSSETRKLLDELQNSMAAFGPMAKDMKLASKMTPAGQIDATIKVGKAEVKGNSATVPITVKPRSGSSGSGAYASALSRPIKCVKENGQWKVDFAQELKMAKQFMAMFTDPAAMGQMQALARQYSQYSAAGAGSRGGSGFSLPSSPSAGPRSSLPAAPRSRPLRPAVTPAAASGNSAAALVQSGLTAKQNRQYDTAAAAFNQALALDPNNVQAHWGLAWVLADQGKKAEAVAHFEKIPTLTKDATMVSEAAKAVARLK